jgi:signal transduction histidine kinase
MVLGFVPLHYAVATYSAVTLQRLQHQHAKTLGRSIAEDLRVAPAGESRASSASALQARVAEKAKTEGVLAVAVYGADAEPVHAAGDLSTLTGFDPRPRDERGELVYLSGGSRLAVVVPGSPPHVTSVAIVMRTDPESAGVTPLVGLLGLYTSLIALALLLAAYFALTVLIVRPLDALAHAADRFASGNRQLEAPLAGAHELQRLGVSLNTMTERLVGDEIALRKKVEEVERATSELRAAQDRLVRSERLASVGRLAAGLAHELGNPLAALSAMADLLAEGGLSEEETQDFLRRMRNEADRMNRILRDLLAFARPAGAPHVDEASPGDVASAVEDTIALVAPQKAAQRLTIETRIGPNLPHVVLSREALVQVVLNLLLNAADACPSGGKVVVEATLVDAHVRLAVTDDGPGVAETVRARLFEPFVTTKDVGAGTGLGLAVCRGLVEGAGGTLDLDTQHAPGARFVLNLPVASPG